MTANDAQLSTLQKVDIFFGFVQALAETTFVAACWPIRDPNTPKSFNKHLLLTLTRKVLSRLSADQLQFIAGSTESNWLAWTRAQGQQPPAAVEIPGIDSKAFWIGDPKAHDIVLYFHGGGFGMPGSSGHFDFMQALVFAASKTGGPASIAALLIQYDLAPAARYPRQLEQAVGILRYVLDKMGKSPDQVMIMGDSAGGNLALGVLSHVLHPHPKIEPLKLSAPLKAAAVSSPVVLMNTSNPRFRTHQALDPADAKTIESWLADLLGPSKPDPWNEPLQNEASWWQGTERVFSRFLIAIAANEMMAVDQSALAAKIQSAAKSVELFKSEVDFHAEPAIGPSLGMEQGEVSKYIISWALQ